MAVAPPAFASLRAAVASSAPLPDWDREQLEAILAHPPATLEEYRLQRIAEWSQPKYELDKRFTRLTLLLDQGPEAQGPRWQAQPKSFDDLRDVLAESRETALVLLGPPGCGKSTLLRRLELDLARDALADAALEEAPLSLFVPLNRYRAIDGEAAPPVPRDWLAAEWAQRYPGLPPLSELLPGTRLILLLDAINEIPHAGQSDYSAHIARWREFLLSLSRNARATRVVFSCRSLDYTAVLPVRGELEVPHVRIEALGDAQVEGFLHAYRPEQGAALWAKLRGTPQLDIFRSPYYLKLLLAHVGKDGTLPAGRAALFTGFVREALYRELTSDNPLFRGAELIAEYERGRILRREWRPGGTDLPTDGPLIPSLADLAFKLQQRRGAGDQSRVRVRRNEALKLLPLAGRETLDAAVALQVMEEQFGDVFFAHQLLQEYFAGRALAAVSQPEFARVSWRAAEMDPSLKVVLANLGDSDPMPPAPATGWEETFVLAAAMTDTSEDFAARLAEANLPLAGRCAAQPDVTLPESTRRTLQHALIARSRDPQADLRARIAAARSLGELGDPRFELHTGPHGPYLLPPMVGIEGGEYVIGSDEGHYTNESPMHRVSVAPFALGQFPVTHAEWRLFMQAGGYEDERWWEGEAAKRWRAGESTAEGPKAEWRKLRERLQADPGLPKQRLEEGRITSKQAEAWEWSRDALESEFESQLAEWYPPGRQTDPDQWNDPAFNHASQPVVGICWYEARAYCTWLSAQTGQTYRLPSEAEWEAAARGRPIRKWYRFQARGRRYAWGEDFDAGRCNSFETHVRGTTPIGVFAEGDTPEGLADMTGNVWEWTSSLYQPYRYDSGDGREDPESERPRVVRGGSWYYDRLGCRCACRGDAAPGDRDYVGGLRLCLAPPIR